MHVCQLMMRQCMDSNQKVMVVRMDYEPPSKPDIKPVSTHEVLAVIPKVVPPKR